MSRFPNRFHASKTPGAGDGGVTVVYVPSDDGADARQIFRPVEDYRGDRDALLRGEIGSFNGFHRQPKK